MSLTVCHQRVFAISSVSHSRPAFARRVDLLKGVGLPSSPRGRKSDQWRVFSGADESSTLRTLPIFPLSAVALPGCVTPLYIFEARYRVLFNTLLSGDADLEEDLIQEDSPFKGTREFGMCFVGNGGMAKVGTLLTVQEHERQPDGQMVIMNEGVERFQVVEILKTNPVIVCTVEMIPDTDDRPSDAVEELSQEVGELYRNVARLSRKVQGNDVEESAADPIKLPDKSPMELSYWFASLFTESQFVQQTILEDRSCHGRLLTEKKIFDDAVKYLSAASAVKGAFQSDV